MVTLWEHPCHSVAWWAGTCLHLWYQFNSCQSLVWTETRVRNLLVECAYFTCIWTSFTVQDEVLHWIQRPAAPLYCKDFEEIVRVLQMVQIIPVMPSFVVLVKQPPLPSIVPSCNNFTWPSVQGLSHLQEEWSFWSRRKHLWSTAYNHQAGMCRSRIRLASRSFWEPCWFFKLPSGLTQLKAALPGPVCDLLLLIPQE